MSTAARTAFETIAAEGTHHGRPGDHSPASVFAAALTLGSLTAVIEGRGAPHEVPVRS